MQLFLVRHGDYIQEAVDPQKPLSDRGRSDVTKVANVLKDRGFCADIFIHSTKKRAHQTAEILRNILNPKGDIAVKEKLSPNDPIDSILNEISAWDKNTMVVGHAPFMPKLVSRLLDREEEAAVAMPTSSVVVLEKNDEQQWRMVDFLKP